MRRRPRRFPDAPAGPLAPRVDKDQVIGCPVRSSLGLFGRKWALLVLRDLTFYPGITFGHMLRRNPGMTQRVLSMRLRELREAGLIEKVVDRVDDRVFHYRLTAKGMDAGGKWRAVGIGRGRPYVLEGEFVEVDPPRKLVHTWRSVGGSAQDSTVTYLVDPIPCGTHLTLRHEGFTDAAVCIRTCLGWETSFEALARILGSRS